MKRSLPLILLTASCVLLGGLSTGCRSTGEPKSQSASSEKNSPGAIDPADVSTGRPCDALEDNEKDQSKRWSPAFAVELGGAVVVWDAVVGSPVSKLVKKWIDEGNLLTRTVHCNDRLVVWIPGLVNEDAILTTISDHEIESPSFFHVWPIDAQRNVFSDCTAGRLYAPRCQRYARDVLARCDDSTHAVCVEARRYLEQQPASKR